MIQRESSMQCTEQLNKFKQAVIEFNAKRNCSRRRNSMNQVGCRNHAIGFICPWKWRIDRSRTPTIAWKTASQFQTVDDEEELLPRPRISRIGWDSTDHRTNKRWDWNRRKPRYNELAPSKKKEEMDFDAWQKGNWIWTTNRSRRGRPRTSSCTFENHTSQWMNQSSQSMVKLAWCWRRIIPGLKWLPTI